MGKVSGGLHGKVSGKLGKLVMFSSGDQQMVRIKAENPTKFSPAQLANQGKFKTMQDWVKPLIEFLRVGCRNNSLSTSGSALAIQYLSANAISLEEGQYRVLPEKMKVSLGTLPGSLAVTVALEDQEAVFSWDTAVGIQCNAYDEVLLLAYNVVGETACYSLKGHFRKDGVGRLKLFQAGEYHCYLSFVAEDRSRQSNSQYLGMLTI